MAVTTEPMQDPISRRPTPLLEPAQVARWLGVSPGWVRDHATRKHPRIRSVKVGKLLRFRADDVEEFIQQSGR